jgi:CBS domain-containing protein
MPLVKTEQRAKDLMTPDPVCIGPSGTIRELARLFEEHEISGVPVVDPSGMVVGIVSKTDLIRRCAEGTANIPPAYLFEVLSDQGGEEDSSEVLPEPLVCVEDFMTEDPLTVAPEMPIGTVAHLMFEKGVHRVIVVDTEKFPLGMITSLDLLGAFPQPQ